MTTQLTTNLTMTHSKSENFEMIALRPICNQWFDYSVGRVRDRM